MKSAIILDRDGVINVDKHYVHKIEDFEFIIGVFESLKILQEKYLLFIFTNQSGIGRGYYSEYDFLKLNKFMLDCLEEKGIKIEEVVYCPHSPEENCDCRKPKTKLLDLLIKKYDIDIKNSYFIGDKTSDIQLAKNLNMKSVLISIEGGVNDKVDNIKPTFVANGLLEASKLIQNV